MPSDVRAELESLKRMSPAELRTKYQEVFGEATRSGNKHFLVKRLAWRLQSEAEGGLSERARRRAAELARDADIRTTMPRAPQKSIGPASQPVASRIARSSSLPMPGTVLTRQYKGRTIEVTVLANGVEWDGQVYRSLTAVAKAITGSHWNGRLFFGLKNGDAQ